MKKTFNRKSINSKFVKKYRNIKEIIEKRYVILIVVIAVCFFIIACNLFYIQIIKNEYYVNKVELANRNIVLGSTAPRGRIYDRHHRLIVDNKPIRVIYYQKENGIKRNEEIEMAYKVAEILDVNFQYLTDTNLKQFWILNNPELANEKITKDEWKSLEERKLTNADIDKFKVDRVTNDELATYGKSDKKAAYIYFLMNKGYSYMEKIIKDKDVTDVEYAKISESLNELNGFNIRLDWERTYPYENVFKSILGSVSTSDSGLPYELKDYYLSQGYTLDDRVGTSYLEFQYENYLKGEKNVYEIIDGNYKLIEEGKRGKDIVLTIDIELQKAVEEILIAELIKTKNEPNTEYYNRSFVVVSEPKTGEILAMAGKQIIKENDEYKIYDYTPGITTGAVVVGSVVKGASNIVAYNNNALKIGEVRDDYCIKIASTPKKCSWKYLGRINDIDSLRYSSNSYQYQSAIKIGEGRYSYDKPLSINPTAFNIYRDGFSEFGLGVKTGIDLPIESLGYKGNSTLTGHLLDFSIGQYDTYTPIQLSQYIGVIANGGYRMQPYLLKSVYEPTRDLLSSIIYNNEPVILNKLNTKDEYLKRVQLGFENVVKSGGTGVNYIPSKFNPAGKTGTSEGFIDTDGDGMVDTETYSNTFIGYAPANNPLVTFTVVSPDTSHNYNKSTYRSAVNKRISYEVSKKFFEIYQ